MLRNKFIIFACMLMTAFNANAGIDQSPTVKVTGWNSGGNANSVNLSSNEFILDGCTSAEWDENCRGTENDEGAIVVQMAHKINDNGALFCPTQIQFANKNHKQWIVAQFRYPSVREDIFSDFNSESGSFIDYIVSAFNNRFCKWICKSGYMGDECKTPVAGYNEKIEPMDFSQLNSGTSVNRNSDEGLIDFTLPVFDIFGHSTASSDRSASVTVLAILKYMNHGVVVGRLKVNGLRDWGCIGGSCIKSWVSGVEYPTEKFMLCDAGYQPNSARTDCEVMPTPEPPKTMCNGWTEAEYTANAANLYYVKRGNCWQYRCSGENRAFTSETNRACTDCGTGVRGGAIPDTGVCRVCNVGQYFNEKNGNCVDATGLSKTDLQYGFNKSKSANTGDECWTKTTPQTYKNCVLEKAPKSPSNNRTGGGSVYGSATAQRDNTSVAAETFDVFDFPGATSASIQ